MYAISLYNIAYIVLMKKLLFVKNWKMKRQKGRSGVFEKNVKLLLKSILKLLKDHPHADIMLDK